MKRLTATAALIVGVTASAAFAQTATEMPNPEMAMLTEKVSQALSDCDLDNGQIDSLTMAQVAGITIANDSEDGSDKCIRIEAIARGE